MPGTWGHDLVWVVIAGAQAAVIALLAAALLRRRAADDGALHAQARVAQLRRAGATAELAEWISHQLGTPLSSMMNNLGAARRLLAERGSTEEAAAAVSEAVFDGERVAQVMARMRSIVRSDAAPREPLDLNDIVREAIQLVERARLAVGVAVTAHHSDDPLRIRGDHAQLLQVVLGLLLNAVDAASASRRRSVVVRTEGAARSVHVSVSDSGPGISERDRPHLFEPFFTRTPGGLGMDLPLARTIVEAHGGTIVVERPVSGAAFRVTLPAEAADVPSSERSVARAGSAGAV